MERSDEILRAALSLPGEERASLADKLLQSLDEDDQERIDRLWAKEAEDRIAAYERGEIDAIPGNEVFAALTSRKRV
ncbi:MAG TPA: addiction module protein [Thermoanaerobaculia bacterium]|jgi:putative addiction module component (TIGR02574 family)|nr:addiction module protein [Thermoanaerobaculia bacterium]